MIQDPTAFRPGPGSPVITPRQMQRFDPAAYNPTDHIPPPRPCATLRVNAAGKVYLHDPLCRALGLRANQPIDLIQPANGSAFWHLDLRPHALNHVHWYSDSRPRTIMSRKPAAGLIQPGTLLTLRLLAGLPTYPGFYPLLAE